MTATLERSSFSIRSVKELNLQLVTELIPLIQGFIKEANEPDRTVNQVLRQVEEIASLNSSSVSGPVGCLWLIEKNNILYGYFLVEMMRSECSSRVALIHGLYVDPLLRSVSIYKDIDEIVGAWARQRGADEIAFYTRRNPVALKRMLYRKKWKVDSTVLKRCV